MLQIQNIQKRFVTGELTQLALDDVSLNLRDNEFVAVLGPSGSGKTTLLNVIGGLDRYDKGELIINGISTKKYRDRDWDSYRNHTIGFVFQSYNLIPHQSILANVELALTISGISRSERRSRARQALEQVGLGNQLHKKPNQMSGGQMQRVAIARALVNNPDILLADEPTGALDSETSIQVMELLKQVANDRLVVMVTHNPELAERYATRIVRLHDGKVIDDSNPFVVDTAATAPPKHKNMGRSSMSFFTAISLSFNNLFTKKGRTLLTSFAGSIGIIGIALILALSGGVNNYITDLQKSTMTSYPISIQEQAVDLSSMIETMRSNAPSKEADHSLDGVYSNGATLEMASSVTTSVTENNLTDFKKYLDDKDSEIHKYVGENGIIYSYNTQFEVFVRDPDDTLVNTDGSNLEQANLQQGGGMQRMNGMIGVKSSGSKHFNELLSAKSAASVSNAITDGYDLLSGSWPDSYNELVLALDENNEIDTTALYELGLLPAKQYKKLIDKINAGEEITVEQEKFDYSELSSQTLYLIPACDTYVKNANGNYDCVADDTKQLEKLLKNALKLKISGVVRPNDDVTVRISSTLGYTRALSDYIIDHTLKSEVVKAQQASKKVNVLNGMSFSPADDKAKIADAKTYVKNLGVTEKAKLCRDKMASAGAAASAQMAAMDESGLAELFDNYMKTADNDAWLEIYDDNISSGSYEDNMLSFGVISLDAPSAINIYTDSFENKDSISECINHYNESVAEEDKITYTDAVGLLMSSVTTIVNVISYVLIAFVAVSLIVSSIMIGIITYISVLERTKEIGILRAIGASKHNITQVFNAETFIIGLFAGLLGIGISALLLIPGNAVIHVLVDSQDVNAVLSPVSSVVLVVLSMLLTLIGGFIPSKKAAKKDPVTALRSE